jgi:mono/diheme cytochrome c family protein
MNPAKYSLMLFAMAFFLLSCATDKTVNSTQNAAAPPPAAASTQTGTPAETASGAQLYSTNCAACHRDNGTGGKVVVDGKQLDPDDLTTKKMKSFTDEKLVNYVRDGVEDEGMPAFKEKLSDQEIKEVVKYVREELQKMPQTPASN